MRRYFLNAPRAMTSAYILLPFIFFFFFKPQHNDDSADFNLPD